MQVAFPSGFDPATNTRCQTRFAPRVRVTICAMVKDHGNDNSSSWCWQYTVLQYKSLSSLMTEEKIDKLHHFIAVLMVQIIMIPLCFTVSPFSFTLLHTFMSGPGRPPTGSDQPRDKVSENASPRRSSWTKRWPAGWPWPFGACSVCSGFFFHPLKASEIMANGGLIMWPTSNVWVPPNWKRKVHCYIWLLISVG